MKALVLALLLLVGRSENTLEPAGQTDAFTSTNGVYTGAVKLGQNDTLVLDDNNTRLGWFTDVSLSATGTIEVIANFGDVDLNLTKMELEGVNFANILIKNFNEDSTTVFINLKQK